MFEGEPLFLQGQGSFAQAQAEKGEEEGGVLLEEGSFEEEGGGAGFDGGKAGGQVALLFELTESFQAGGEAALEALLMAPLEEAGVGGGPAEIDAEAFFDLGDGLGAGHGGVQVASPVDFWGRDLSSVRAWGLRDAEGARIRAMRWRHVFEAGLGRGGCSALANSVSSLFNMGR